MKAMTDTQCIGAVVVLPTYFLVGLYRCPTKRRYIVMNFNLYGHGFPALMDGYSEVSEHFLLNI
jgi:hypothetical protein